MEKPTQISRLDAWASKASKKYSLSDYLRNKHLALTDGMETTYYLDINWTI